MIREKRRNNERIIQKLLNFVEEKKIKIDNVLDH